MRAGWLKQREHRTVALCVIAAGASGVLLWLAYPPKASPEAAWFALVPLILLARHRTPREAFRWGWGSGVLFWGLSLTWFWRLAANGGPLPMVILGYLALTAYSALYWGGFAALVAWLWERRGASAMGAAAEPLSAWGELARLGVEPLLWVGMEYLRSTLLSGFAWNSVGVSQFRNLPVIQIAALGGVYAVSGLVLLVNSALAGVSERVWRLLLRRPGRRRHLDLILALAAIMLCWAWGLWHLRRESRGGAVLLHVAAIQPNTPSIFELTDDMVDTVRSGLRRQSLLASASRPDLIVWPETSLLGWLPHDPGTYSFVSGTAAELGAPLLAGTIGVELAGTYRGAPDYRYYNSSWLFDRHGQPVGHYRKQHLVPFGEYFPLDRRIRWLRRFSPVGFSCTPGRGSGRFRIRAGMATNAATEAVTVLFSPLICFEDTLAYLGRQAVRDGAQFLVNQTNDAWFDGSSEPLQHMAQSVFRCVENGVPMVRCANSGVTCVIAASGQIQLLELDGQQSGFAGFLIGRVRPARPDAPQTPYTRFGDALFALPAAALCVLLAGSGLLRVHRTRRDTTIG